MWLAVTGYIVSVTFARYHVRLSKASYRYGGSVRTDRRGLSRVVNLTCDKLGFINANIKKGKSTAYTSVRATIWDPHFRWYLNFLIFPYSLVEGRRSKEAPVPKPARFVQSFGTPTCDGRTWTDGQGHSTYHVSIASRGKSCCLT